MTKFRLKRSIKRKRGKLVEVKMLESFESVCAWLEKEEIVILKNCMKR